MISAAVTCLALTIYHEARGEPVEGQIAVAEVVLNRTATPGYPDTVCAVVFDDRQFSWTADEIVDRPTDAEAWEDSLFIARMAIERPGLILSDNPATHYHEASIQPGWADDMFPVGRIGRHIFYTRDE